MEHLAQHTGSWVGSNAFRLMPADAPRHAPFRATVSLAAGGPLAQVAYTWEHPADGAQDGLLVLGEGDEHGSVSAFWGDSWHQRPQPRGLEGRLDGGLLTVGSGYGGDWRWEIVVDATATGQLSVSMMNVVPASAASGELAAGPYAAMHAVLLPG